MCRIFTFSTVNFISPLTRQLNWKVLGRGHIGQFSAQKSTITKKPEAVIYL